MEFCDGPMSELLQYTSRSDRSIVPSRREEGCSMKWPLSCDIPIGPVWHKCSSADTLLVATFPVYFLPQTGRDFKKQESRAGNISESVGSHFSGVTFGERTTGNGFGNFKICLLPPKLVLDTGRSAGGHLSVGGGSTKAKRRPKVWSKVVFPGQCEGQPFVDHTSK